MPLDSAAILKEIDEVIENRNALRKMSKFNDMSDLGDAKMVEVVSVLRHTIDRFAPPGNRTPEPGHPGRTPTVRWTFTIWDSSPSHRRSSCWR